MARLNLPVASLNVGNDVQEESFAIGNLSVVLYLLRSKMYSNPIRTIIQEIGSNARDANREVGNGTKPIYVKLPTALEPDLWIQDFGPGITPERMSGVYLKYGNSTKRESEEETGCFGLGAKSPFSYVSSFGIETITEEHDGSRMLRVYVATIDEKQIGKVLKCSEQATDKPTGTTIKIPVKENDIQEFKRWTSRVMNRWNPLPATNLDDVFQPVHEPDIMGDDWEIYLGREVEKGITYYEDQIPYAVEHKNFEKVPDHLYPFFSRVQLNLFGKNKIMVTGNRESLDYQPEVQQYLIEKLEEIYKKVNADLTSKVSSCKTLWDAMCLVHEQEEAWGVKLLKDVQWKGEKVPNPDSISFSGANTYTVEGDSSKIHGVKIMNRPYSSFSARRSNILIENHNQGRPNPAYVARAYEQAKEHFEEKDIKHWNLFIISIYDAAAAQATMDKVRYAEWGIPSLLEYKPERQPRGKNGYKRSQIIKVRKFNPHRCYDDNYEKTWDKTQIDLSDAEGGIYIPLHSRHIDIDVSLENVEVFCNFTNKDVFGIPRRLVDKGLGKQWIPFKQAVSETVDQQIAANGNVIYECDYNTTPNDILNSDIYTILQEFVKDGQVNGKIKKWFDFSFRKGLRSTVAKLARMCGRADDIVTETLDDKYVKEISKSFPMLMLWNGKNYSSSKFILKQQAVLREWVLQYVKAQEDAEKALAEKMKTVARDPQKQPYYGILNI